MSSLSIPSGFVRLQSVDAFQGDIGPLYCRSAGEYTELGFLVASQHLGPNGCHGGMLCSIAEIAIDTEIRKYLGPRERFQLVTLDTQFVNVAPLGSWISGRAEILRKTKNFVFITAMLCMANTLVLRASGVVGRVG